MKKSIGEAEPRLFGAAIGCSILFHAAAIGGVIWWQSGHGESGTALRSEDRRQIQIQIQTLPKNSPQRISSANSSSRVGSAAAEQSDRVHSRRIHAATISAGRLLEDPATGLIFSAYFKVIKAHLARSVRETSAELSRDVSVRFVLSREGGLEAVSTPFGTSRADRAAVALLLEAAAPFPAFPPTIRHASIAFDVLFRSDKNMLV